MANEFVMLINRNNRNKIYVRAGEILAIEGLGESGSVVTVRGMSKELLVSESVDIVASRVNEVEFDY